MERRYVTKLKLSKILGKIEPLAIVVFCTCLDHELRFDLAVNNLC